MFQVLITPSAKRAAKNLPQATREEILKQSQKLKKNPYLGEELSGSLHFLYSFHIRFKGTEYRLAYTIDKSRKLIVVHLIGPRENFYEKLKRLLR